MSTKATPENAPEDCPGTQSEAAGTTEACQGCPNQEVCASGQPRAPDPAVAEIQSRMSTVKHKVLVLSGKGGVGKSTFAAHLARGLAAEENRQVAVLDIDICGPSIPKVFGCEGEQVHHSNSGWSPVYVEDNLAVMSVGFLLSSPDDAVIWRGPKKNGLIKQFLRDVDWGEVDYLIIDTPPGTSDEHLSAVQYLSTSSIDGAVVVTTPQEVALLDVRKEISFCRKVGLPILGVVENMSGFVCPKCKKESKIFPPTTGGGMNLASESGVPFLGSIPLDPRIGRCCDEGKSYLSEVPDSPSTEAYRTIVDRIVSVCAKGEEKGDDEQVPAHTPSSPGQPIGLQRKRKWCYMGQKVVLAPYTRRHVPRYHTWMQSTELLSLTASEPLSLEEEYQMQESWMKDNDKVTFIVLNRDVYLSESHSETAAMVGDVNLFFNDPDDTSAAEIDVMIAEPGCRGRGLGTEAVTLMMSYAMSELNVALFRAKIAQHNTASLGFFHKLGFVEASRSEVFKEVTFEFSSNSPEADRTRKATEGASWLPYA